MILRNPGTHQTYNHRMPPRHAYWTILIDDQPTAFRAHDPEELLPTLNRLREKNASANMKWFERGQLFDSREAAREAGLGKGERRWEGPRPARDDHAAGPPRNKDWRPGGEHRDPRQRYKDAKKAKWTRFKEKIRERHEQRQARDPQRFSPPHGDPLRDSARGEPGIGRDRAQSPRDDRSQPDGAPTRPHGDKYGDQRPQKPDWRSREDQGRRLPKPQWRDRDERDQRPPKPAWRTRDERDQRPPKPAWRTRDQRDQRPPKPAWRTRDERDQRPPKPAWRTRDDARSTGWKRDERTPRDSDRYDTRDTRPRTPRRDEERREWKPKDQWQPKGDWKPAPTGRKPFGKQGAGKKPFAKKAFAKKPFARKPSGAKPSGPRRRRRDDDE
jgi:hypothetical protein